MGFDDLRFSAELHKALVPAGRTGRVDLVDPEGHAVEAISGISAPGPAGRGHEEGTTSADCGLGLVFASDRTGRAIVVADPAARRVVTRAQLGGGPLGGPNAPGEEALETFRVDGGAATRLRRTGEIAIPG